MTKIISFAQEQLNNTSEEVVPENFEKIGFIDAGKVGGSSSAFNIALAKLFSHVLFKKDLNQYDCEDKIKKSEQKINMLKDKIEVHEKEISRLQNKELHEAEHNLKISNEELREFKTNPSAFVSVEKDNFMLWVYGILSLLIALFLFFFYSNVIYSALFRDITINKFTLYDSIFYSRTFEDAYSKGISSLIIVLLAPFVFLGLGIVFDNVKAIHKKFFVAVFTFLLDALFAYHISERIYNAKAINAFENFKPYTILDAIIDLNFWMIIALGFFVYLLFGYIFSKFNEQRRSKSKFNEVENKFKAKVAIAHDHIKNIKTSISDLQKEIYSLKLNITEIEKDNDKIFYSPNEVIKILSDYAIGWIRYLQNANSPESEIQKVESSLNNFYLEKGLK